MVNGYGDGSTSEAPMETDVVSLDGDEDDPITHQIPVFLAKTLADKLYLFQYPVRPANMTYDSSEVIEAKVRPNNQQVELSLAIETGSANYNASKGEQIALNVDGCRDTAKKKAADEKVFSSGIMDKQVLRSSRALTNPSRYAVGILGNNELHITPIKSVLNLRPDLSYLDKSDKTARAEGRAAKFNEDPDDPVVKAEIAEAKGEEELKQVTVRFAKGGDAEHVKKMREKSYEYQMKKVEEEPWIQTRFHPSGNKSSKWEEEAQKLFCKRMDEEAVPRTQAAGTKEYLSTLTEHQQL